MIIIINKKFSTAARTTFIACKPNSVCIDQENKQKEKVMAGWRVGAVCDSSHLPSF